MTICLSTNYFTAIVLRAFKSNDRFTTTVVNYSVHVAERAIPYSLAAQTMRHYLHYRYLHYRVFLSRKLHSFGASALMIFISLRKKCVSYIAKNLRIIIFKEKYRHIGDLIQKVKLMYFNAGFSIVSAICNNRFFLSKQKDLYNNVVTYAVIHLLLFMRMVSLQVK